MLTTAGTTSAIFAVGVLTGALIGSAWGFLDLVVRPSPACKVAHVSKDRWLLVLGLSALTILTSTLCLLLIVPASVFIGIDAVACVVGLVGGAWYLAMVRPWIADQIRFVRRRAEAN
jgi:hypothetical protein